MTDTWVLEELERQEHEWSARLAGIEARMIALHERTEKVALAVAGLTAEIAALRAELKKVVYAYARE